MRRVALLSLLLSLVALPAASEKPQPLTAHDLISMERISDPQPAPDGSRASFTVRTTDLEANRGRTDLWMVGLDGTAPRRLTTNEASDHSARWAPDGKSLYFLSSRSGSSQVWRLPLEGGEASQVTDLPLDVGGFVLSPDGARLALALEVYTDCGDLACTEDRNKEKEDAKTTGIGYDQIFMRHWDHWKGGTRSQLFVLELGAEEAKPVRVSQGIEGDVPSKPFGGMEEVAFTPDSQGVVFAARVAGKGEPWSTNFDLYSAPVDGSKAPRNLTEANKAWDTHPVFSPDGNALIYFAMERPGYEADRFRIRWMDWPSGKTRTIAGEWDRSPSSVVVSEDSKTLYVTATDLGHRSLFSISVATGKVQRLLADGSIRSPSLVGDRLLFGRDHLGSPVELYTLGTDGSDLEAITAVNGDRMAGLEMGQAEQFTFAGWNGETVHAWMVKPAGFQEGKKYPLAFLIHGGPQGSFGSSFHYRWNPQTYAGAGYVSVMVDFHGSTGYGQSFTDSIGGDWGGKPLEDLQKGLAAALERYPFIDGERACALGASYGGYMINWIAGNWSDQFQCLVNHDGVFDMRSMYYTTEELWFPEWEHGGAYFDNPEGHERHNPAAHVKNWKTPMLVIHGALDYRVPEGQGIGAFTALQRQGIPSRFLYFPDENHWVLKPANSIQWHEEVLAWLGQWTKP